jgi:DNA-directed RNA polymerase subunit omega
MNDRPTLIDPPVEVLLSHVDNSKFTLVAVAAERAREINDYYNGLGSGHGKLVPPQVTSLSNKSLSLAMQELAEGKLVYRRPTAEEIEAERLAEEQARAEAAAELDPFGEFTEL